MDLQACEQILIFGGSFDPPHRAHVKLPQLAAQAVGADGIAYVPAAVSPFKQIGGQTPAEHRLAMLRVALAEVTIATIITDEIDRAADGVPSYTIDTIVALRQRLGDTCQLRLLIGTDQLRLLDHWKAYERIIELAEPLVMLRPPDTRDQLLASLPTGFVPQQWDKRLVDVPPMDISSSQVRQMVAEGRPIEGWVGPKVAQYIRQNGLYCE